MVVLVRCACFTLLEFLHVFDAEKLSTRTTKAKLIVYVELTRLNTHAAQELKTICIQTY